MIAIYEDQGGDLRPDDYDPVSVYDDGEWLVDHGGYSTYYPEGTPEAAIASQIDGPSAVAVEVTGERDAVLNDVSKAEDQQPSGEVESVTDRANDSESGEDATPAWQVPSETEKDRVGPPMSSTLADFEVTEVETDPSDEDDEDGEEP